jgi:hypothetical protein
VIPTADQPPWTAWFAALGLPGLLYAFTVYSGPGGRVSIGDAVKFQFVGRALSVPHEPGYPQYVILSFLWSYLPLPLSLAAKINLLSAFCALIAGAFVLAIAYRFSRSAIAAVFAVWFLLLSADVWLLATQAEVYTLNLAWVAAVVYTGLRWRDSGNRKWLVAMMFCYALSFGNHLLMITLLPALFVLVLATDPSVFRNVRMLAAGAAAVALGVSQYAFLWWRSYNPGRGTLPRFLPETSFTDILRWSAGAHFTARHFLASGPAGWPGRWAEAWWHGAVVLTPLMLLLAALGLWVLWRRDRGSAAFLAVIAVGVTAFAAAYEIRSWPFYCFPAWLALLVAASVGTQDVMRRGKWPRTATPLVLIGALGYVAAGTMTTLLATDEPYLDERALVAVPTEGVLVPGLPGRTSKNLGHYYRTALARPDLDAVDFIGARDLVLDPLILTSDRPIYVQSPDVADWLTRRGIERIYTLGRGGRADQFGLLQVRPVEEVTFQRHPDDQVSVRTRRRAARLDVSPLVHVTIVEADLARLRTTLQLPVDRAGLWREQLRLALLKTRRRETVVIGALGLDVSALRSLAHLFERLGTLPESFGVEPRDYVVAGVRGPRTREPLVWEFADRVVVPLPLPATR